MVLYVRVSAESLQHTQLHIMVHRIYICLYVIHNSAVVVCECIHH